MMTDQTEAPEGLQTESPAEALNTESTVPYSRFENVNSKYREIEKELVELRATQQQQRETELTEQKRYQELAEQRGQELETARIKGDRVDALEQALEATLTARIEALSDSAKSLMPTHGTPQERLAWLDKNMDSLSKPKAPGIDGGAGSSASTAQTMQLTNVDKMAADGFGITHEQYAKRKAERAAQMDESVDNLTA